MLALVSLENVLNHSYVVCGCRVVAVDHGSWFKWFLDKTDS